MSIILAKEELELKERTAALTANVPDEVKTVEDFQRACRLKLKAGRLIRAIESACKDEKQKRYLAHKEASKEEAELLAPVKTFDHDLTEAIKAFVQSREQEKQWLMESVDGDDMDAAARAMASQVPAFPGISIGKRWRGVCVDLMALVKLVALGGAPLEFLCANQSALDEWAQGVKSLDAGSSAVRATYDVVVKATGKVKDDADHGNA